MTKRSLLASALSAAVGVVTFEVLFSVTSGGATEPRFFASIVSASFYFLLFGWPIAFVSAIIAARLGLPFVANTTPIRRIAVSLLVGATTGGLVAPMIWSVFWGDWADWPNVAASGSVAGVFAAGTFVLLAFAPRTRLRKH